MSKDEVSVTNQSIISNQLKQTIGSQNQLNQDLLKKIELLDNDNCQLREGLKELQNDLKEKEISIDESEKMITKLKDEYSKLIKNYQDLNSKYTELLNENKKNQKILEKAKKTEESLKTMGKKNLKLTNEINKLNKKNSEIKSKMNSSETLVFKNEKDKLNKDNLIKELNEKNESLINMVKEREILIEEQSKKIKEINNELQNKDEQLKILFNYSKEINNESKINFKEFTLQLMNIMKNYQTKSKKSLNSDSADSYTIKFKNTKTTFEDFEPIFKNNKACFALEDAVNGNMFIPKDLQTVSKEFLMDMNFKTALIKSELYSSLIRENLFYNFIQKIIGYIKPLDKNNYNDINKYLIEIKKKYIVILKENNKLKKINQLLLNINDKNNLNIKQLQELIKSNNEKIKEKIICFKQNAINDFSKNLNKKENFYSDNDNNNNFMKYKNCSISRYTNRTVSINIPTPKTPNVANNKISLIKVNNIISSMNSIECNSKRNNICYNIVNAVSQSNVFSKNKKTNSLEYNSSINDNTISSALEAYNKKNEKKYFNNPNILTERKTNRSYKENIIKLRKEMHNIINKTISPDSHFKNKINFTGANTDKNKDLKKIQTKSIKKNIFIKYNPPFKNVNRNFTTVKQYDSSFIQNNKSYITTKYNKIFSNKNEKNNNIFTYDFFIKSFFKINNKIFEKTDLQKYQQKYYLKDNNINSVFALFKQNCDLLKKKINESNLQLNEEGIEKNNYNLYNFKIIEIKKLEIDAKIFTEFIKNYLVSQEITVKIMFNEKKYQFEPIEKLFNLLEECLCYKMQDMNENILFFRKLFIKLLKSQINCLFLSFENI